VQVGVTNAKRISSPNQQTHSLHHHNTKTKRPATFDSLTLTTRLLESQLKWLRLFMRDFEDPQDRYLFCVGHLAKPIVAQSATETPDFTDDLF
jgi:hypothetical protein